MKSLDLMRLEQIRLDRDLSFRELADAVGLKLPTLYRVLTTPHTRVRVHARTAHKIERFLERAS